VIILSSYYLDDVQNERIREFAEARGLTFVPSTSEDRDERIRLLEERIGEASILLGGRLTDDQMNRARLLRWIHVPWAGVNSLLAVESVRRSNVVITNSSGVMSDSVADQVMAYMLLIARNLVPQLANQSTATWESYSVHDGRRRRMRGSTVGLLGYGAIGKAVARRAAAFGMKVLAFRATQNRAEPDDNVRFVPLNELLANSDFVVVALPLTDATRGFVGREALAMMKRSAYLINIARGEVVDEDALIESLREHVIAGAALDVFRKEPLPSDSPLWHMPNVIVTPHTSGGFSGFGASVVDLFLENLSRYCDHRDLLNVVDKAAGY
jgi:phosphoglycerate dehydrogenase-like enzyme